MNKFFAIVLAALAVVLPVTSEARDSAFQVEIFAPPLPLLLPIPIGYVHGYPQYANERSYGHGYDAPRLRAGYYDHHRHHGHPGYYDDRGRHGGHWYHQRGHRHHSDQGQHGGGHYR